MASEKSKTPSELILNLGEKIEATIGVKLKFAQGSTAPIKEWIPKNQMSPTKVLTLRTAEETRQDNVMKLHQFNPSFFLVEPNGIPCRVPGCQVKIPQLKPNSSSEDIKQDLFLCEIHRTKMANLVSQRCEKENVSISVVSYRHEDFNGYTHLIGGLEKGFMHLMKKPATRFVPSQLYANSDLQLAEVFLNTRNFLIITNALLNPNGDNIDVALPGLFVMFNSILSSLHDPHLLSRLVRALRDIMDIIFDFFGIIYAWVFLGNPGAQVGGGVGLVLVAAGAAFLAFPLAGVIAGAALGLVGGNLIGGGGYAWHQRQHEIDRQNERVREYQQFVRQQFGQAPPRLPHYHVPANPDGDLVLNAAYAAPAM